tara:strand:+ start:986 stop:1393 length:408 start_codon:yes stop_codon:yes gene_type:complete
MKNKIVVLGGSSGIGKSISERFAKEGWQVIFTGSNAAKCQKALESLVGDGHLICISDVRLDSDIKKLSQLVSTEIGEIDAFVNSIGISESVPVLDSEFSKWDNSLQVMLYGSVKCTRALIPFLKDELATKNGTKS